MGDTKPLTRRQSAYFDDEYHMCQKSDEDKEKPMLTRYIKQTDAQDLAERMTTRNTLVKLFVGCEMSEE